jgi:hypothetical protein
VVIGWVISDGKTLMKVLEDIKASNPHPTWDFVSRVRAGIAA